LTPAKKPVRVKPVAKYTVVSGDSFARIAQKQYGSQKYTSFLIEANPQVKNPNRLKIGQVLNVPPLSDTKDAAAVVANRPTRARNPNERTYVVQENDNFFDIALAQLGDGGRWPEIYERNKDEVGTDPMNLKPGQVLRLPAK
jgi:nucleoid-associated protein YgaU